METFSALLAICAGNSPVPAQRPVTRSFDVFCDLHPNKRLSKQSWGWWFETLSRPLWRHCNGKEMKTVLVAYCERKISGQFAYIMNKFICVWKSIDRSMNEINYEENDLKGMLITTVYVSQRVDGYWIQLMTSIISTMIDWRGTCWCSSEA